MDTPLRLGDVARMVAAQVCFIGAVGSAVVAGMLVCDRLDPDIVAAIGMMIALSTAAIGIGVVLLSGKVRYGFAAAFAVTIALFFALYFLHLLASLLDFGPQFGGGRL